MTVAADIPDTLADVVRALGDVPLHRIIWRNLGTATEADILAMKRVELVDGILVEKSGSFPKGCAEVGIGGPLWECARRTSAGAVTAATAPHRLAAGVVRLPDVAFTRWDRFRGADGRIPDIVPGAPDLVVEIPTADNPPAELARKRREFFAAGTRLLWEFDLDARTVAVFRNPEACVVLTTADTLDGGTVLPGFAVALAELFADPQFTLRRPA
jgi:hypothetical protein